MDFFDPAEMIRRSLNDLDPAEMIRRSLNDLDPIEAVRRSLSDLSSAEIACRSLASFDPSEALYRSLEALDPSEMVRHSLDNFDIAGAVRRSMESLARLDASDVMWRSFESLAHVDVASLGEALRETAETQTDVPAGVALQLSYLFVMYAAALRALVPDPQAVSRRALATLSMVLVTIAWILQKNDPEILQKLNDILSSPIGIMGWVLAILARNQRPRS